VQWLSDDGACVRVALQSQPGAAWTVDETPGGAASRHTERAGLQDVCDWSEVGRQARAARRGWGHDEGAEWTPQQGTRRFSGDVLRAIDE
jgi:hypothetical protein